MKFAAAILLAIPAAMATQPNLRNAQHTFALSDGDEPCCVDACTVEGEEKYYSIDTRHDLCGECCMNPSDFDLYKKFEKGLEKAPDGDDSPCTGFGYPKYTETVTHGAFNIKMTLDLYDHADEEVNKLCGPHVYFAVNDGECPNGTTLCQGGGEDSCCTQGEMCIPNVGCRC
ncbi:hypothetical protein TL16_g11359 [Triparma laevis f. inornata]|uniref:Uncharacterized protein n=1 Tax=Triparma laevis f. inornata TaxID=1714386 RepID=A0A9W7BK51_9STRA|nr:hypothetical protein TL16_g11359 [Triparma laevis f. inornata]